MSEANQLAAGRDVDSGVEPVVRVQVRAPLADVVPRVCALLAAGRSVVCELPTVTDLAAVDAVARLRLLAVRLGGRLAVVPDPAGVLELCGLSALLGGDPGRQAEPGEQRRVQEVVDVDELPL